MFSHHIVRKPSLNIDPAEPLIATKIFGKEYIVYADTGSTFCAVTSSLVSTFLEKGAKLHKQNFRINLAQGQAKSQGYFIVDVTIQDRTVRQKFLVLDELIRPVIVGRDFMCKAQISLHFNPNGWTFHSDDEIVYSFERPTKLYLNMCFFETDVPEAEPCIETLFEGSILSEEGNRKLLDIVKAHSEIFSEKPGLTHLVTHKIELVDKKPFSGRLYPMSEEKRRIMLDLVKEMVADGILEKRYTKYVSSPILLKKRNGTYKLVHNSKQLNSQCKPEKKSLPDVFEAISNIGDRRFYSRFDLPYSYAQCLIEEESQQYTGIMTPDGIYVFKRGCYGLRSMPFTLNRLMQLALGDMYYTKVITYYDDLILSSGTEEEHLKNLEEFFGRIKEAGLTLSMSKSRVAVSSIDFLGFHIEHGLITCQPEKLKQVEQFQPPKNVKQLQRMLGFFGFFRLHIPNMSEITAPLVKYLKKDVKFSWGKEEEDALQKLKSRLLADPHLMLPRLQDDFHLYVDASNIAIGFTLCQKNQDGRLMVVAFGSKKLTATQANYSTTMKELLAIVLGLERFEYFLIHSPCVFIYTDHQALIHIFKASRVPAKVSRWIARIGRFHAILKFTSGKRNIVDFLSRITTNHTEDEHFKGRFDVNENFPLEDLCDFGFVKFQDSEGNLTDLLPDSNFELSFASLYNGKSRKKALKKDQPELDVNRSPHRYSPLEISALFLNLPFADTEEIVLRESVSSKFSTDAYWIKHQDEDPIISSLKKCLMDSEDNSASPHVRVLSRNSVLKENGLLYRKIQRDGNTVLVLWVPEVLRCEVLLAYHDSPLACHPCFRLTYRKIREKYTWLNMRKDIEKYCLACVPCSRFKHSTVSKQGFMASSLSYAPGDTLYIDTMGPLVRSKPSNFSYVLICVDHFTKFLRLYPLRKVTSKSIVSCLEHLFTHDGYYNKIISDNCSVFTSQLWNAVIEQLHSKSVHITPFRAQGNLAEVYVKATKKAIAMFSKEHCRWADNLNQIEFALNNRPNFVHPFTPSYLHFGRQLRDPYDLQEVEETIVEPPEDDPQKYSQYVSHMRLRITDALRVSRLSQEKALEMRARKYNKGRRPHQYKIGDVVRMKLVHISNAARGIVGKLEPKWSSSLKIKHQTSTNTFILEDEQTLREFRANVDQMKKVHPPPEFGLGNFCQNEEMYKKKRPSDGSSGHPPRIRFNFRERDINFQP